jgi:hypothetical protein
VQCSSNPDINIEYSSAIKEKLAEKWKLHKLWQTNKCSYEKQIKSEHLRKLLNSPGMEPGDTRISN